MMYRVLRPTTKIIYNLKVMVYSLVLVRLSLQQVPVFCECMYIAVLVLPADLEVGIVMLYNCSYY